MAKAEINQAKLLVLDKEFDKTKLMLLNALKENSALKKKLKFQIEEDSLVLN